MKRDELILPKTEVGVSVEEVPTQNILLNDKEQVFLNGSRSEIGKITNTLYLLKKEKKSINVLLKADRNVEYGRIVDILNALRTIGVHNAAISLQKEE